MQPCFDIYVNGKNWGGSLREIESYRRPGESVRIRRPRRVLDGGEGLEGVRSTSAREEGARGQRVEGVRVDRKQYD